MNSVFSAASPNLWVVVLCTQVEQNLSLITACVPYHKPFFKSVESGMLRNDDLRRRDKYATIQEYAMSMFRPGGKDRGQDGSERIARHDTAAGHNRPFDGLDTNATTMMSNARHSPHGIPELDTGSSRGTDRLVIKEARDFRLEYSDVEVSSCLNNSPVLVLSWKPRVTKVKWLASLQPRQATISRPASSFRVVL